MNFFDVVGSRTGKRYRIHYGQSVNVRELDEAGNPKMGWCFVPKGYLVAGDVMLAQKIALETDELAVLAVARRFPPVEPVNHRALLRHQFEENDAEGQQEKAHPIRLMPYSFPS
jgi:hypothetical protein